MKLTTKVTKERIKNHFAYGLWKYLLAAALIICGINILYTTTSYHSPNYLKVDIYASAPAAQEAVVKEYGEQARQAVLPNVEEINFILMTSASDDVYYDAQISVYIYAGEGDLFLLNRDKIKSLAGSGAFLDLTPYVESGALDVTGLDLTYGYIMNEDDNQTYLYAIPTDHLPGFAEKLGIANEQMMIAVTAYSANPDDAITFLNYMLKDFRAPAAE